MFVVKCYRRGILGIYRVPFKGAVGFYHRV